MNEDNDYLTKLRPNLFQIEYLNEYKPQNFQTMIFPEISLIFIPDQYMYHLFHFIEHLLGVYATLMEFYGKNGIINVNKAIFPYNNNTKKYKNRPMCLGKKRYQ